MSNINTRNDSIRIRGARVRNLKNVNIDIPRDQFVVIAGPSGSGKSSLAFDTLFAEGQRQYIESLSVYARQFLHQLERPDVDLIEGLQPTICIDQRPGNTNPRSTLATVNEIYDYLRLLMSRLGEPVCYECGAAIQQQTASQIQEALLEMPLDTKFIYLTGGPISDRRIVRADVREVTFNARTGTTPGGDHQQTEITLRQSIDSARGARQTQLAPNHEIPPPSSLVSHRRGQIKLAHPHQNPLRFEAITVAPATKFNARSMRPSTAA